MVSCLTLSNNRYQSLGYHYHYALRLETMGHLAEGESYTDHPDHNCVVFRSNQGGDPSRCLLEKLPNFPDLQRRLGDLFLSSLCLANHAERQTSPLSPSVFR